jgi:peptidoglycan/xylan/chitin deacetylase (PgdA/CDA1 family)
MRNTAVLSAILVSTLASLLGAGCADEAACDEGDEACHSEEAGAEFEAAYEEALEPGKEDGTDCSGVRVPDRTNFNKRIALTFDDGPNPATTPKVIEVLKAHHAPATFFINGSRLGSQAARDIAARVAADPDFILANHSQNHINLALQTAAKVADEVTRTDTLIRAAGETPKYFRFPFGSAACSSKAYVQSKGYIVTGWHIDSADWCYASGNGVCKKSTFQYVPDELRSDMLGYIKSQVRANNGGVILMHDIHSSTANHLDAILTMLEADGYTFVRLDNTAAFPKLNGVTPPPAAPQAFIGDKCTTNAQCAFTAGGQTGRCHAAGFCTISCQGSCPDYGDRAATFCIADAAAPTGLCVSKAAQQNLQCEKLPGTTRRDADRFLGMSTAAPARATVCAPR